MESIVPTLAGAASAPLPRLNGKPVTKLLLRGLAAMARTMVLRVEGGETIRRAPDPFILALNHNQYLESVFAPAVLMTIGEGRRIRFMADWNFMMIPGVLTLYRRFEAIPVTRKAARPRVLTGLRPWLVKGPSGYALARQCLREGQSIGVFPEGTINRNPLRLLPGERGAARLSIEFDTPVIPAGIRFPRCSPARPIPHFEPMEIHVGKPMRPSEFGIVNARAGADAWHAAIMEAIADLSGKEWISPRVPETPKCA